MRIIGLSGKFMSNFTKTFFEVWVARTVLIVPSHWLTDIVHHLKCSCMIVLSVCANIILFSLTIRLFKVKISKKKCKAWSQNHIIEGARAQKPPKNGQRCTSLVIQGMILTNLLSSVARKGNGDLYMLFLSESGPAKRVLGICIEKSAKIRCRYLYEVPLIQSLPTLIQLPIKSK